MAEDEQQPPEGYVERTEFSTDEEDEDEEGQEEVVAPASSTGVEGAPSGSAVDGEALAAEQQPEPARIERTEDERRAVAEKLAAVPLFAKAIEATADESASQAFLELLSSHVEAKRVPVGSLIIRKGDIGKEMFFLMEGEVEVLMMLDHTPVATLQPGAAFGEMALLREEPRNAYIRASAGVSEPSGGALAADMVHLLVLSREGLRQVAEQFPSIQAALADDSQQRQSALEERDQMEKTHALTMATMTGEVGAGALVGWEVILLDDDAAPSAAAGSLRSSLRNSMNSPRDAQQELPEGTVFVIGYKMRAGRTTLHEIARPREDSGQINALLKELMTMKMGAMKKKAAEVGADPAEVAAALGDDADDPKADLIKVITAAFKANLPPAPTQYQSELIVLNRKGSARRSSTKHAQRFELIRELEHAELEEVRGRTIGGGSWDAKKGAFGDTHIVRPDVRVGKASGRDAAGSPPPAEVKFVSEEEQAEIDAENERRRQQEVEQAKRAAERAEAAAKAAEEAEQARMAAWTVPTTLPHITNWVPELRSRNRRGSILRTLNKVHEERVFLAGLSGAGKSTFLEQLVHSDPILITTTPATPFDGKMSLVEPSRNMRLMIWDMNGSPDSRRNTWSDQAERCTCVVFVFDCSDRASLDEAREELMAILANEKLSPTAPLLVWANKMDVRGSITETELSEKLTLWLRADCERRQWCIQGAVMHDRARGMDAGMKWLYMAFSQKPKKSWTSQQNIPVESENKSELIVETEWKPPATVKEAVAAAQMAAGGDGGGGEDSSPSHGRGRARVPTMDAMEEGAEEEDEEEEDEEGGEAEGRQDGSPPRTPLKSTLSAHEDLAKRGIFKTSFLANYTPSGKLGKKHHEFRLLMCGPEHAGKTTFVMQLQKKTHIAWETSHSKVEGEMSMIMHGSAAIFCWDMNGSPEGRAVWAQHVEDLGPGAMSGVVYVIDATAPYTLHLAQRELERLLSFPNLESKCPVLIIANKHDVADVNPAMSCHAIADALNLRALSRRWCVQECSALLGTGVEQALDWLCGAEAAKPRRHEANLLAEESARVLRSEELTSDQNPTAEQVPAYLLGNNYTVTKASGKGKNSVLKLSCGTMGVQTFKPTGEHVKSYPYKELAEWVQGATMIMHLKKSEKKEMISLFKRDRNMGSTDFLTEDGDAEKIIAELNQLARGGTSPRPAAPSASKEPISVRLAQAERSLWAAVLAEDMPRIAALSTEVEILAGAASTPAEGEPKRPGVSVEPPVSEEKEWLEDDV